MIDFYSPFSRYFWVGMAICICVFFAAGRSEGRSAMVWAALSALVWVATPADQFFKLGGQGVLFFALLLIYRLADYIGSRRKS